MKMIGHGKNRWEYLLRATCNGIASDTDIADETSFNVSAPGSVEDGTLYANDDGAGTVTVFAGARIETDCTAGGFRSQAIAMKRGRCLFGNVGMSSTTAKTAFGFSDTESGTVLADFLPFVWQSTDYDLFAFLYNSSGATEFSLKFKTAAQWSGTKVAIMAGGYNSSGVPWNGSDLAFNAGWNWFYHDGTNWLLIYRMFQAQTSTMYAKQYCFNTERVYTGWVKIPDADLSYLIQPTNLSTSVSTADTFTHYSDCFVEMLITTLPSSGNLDLEIRRQDDSNKWIARATSAGAVSLQEVVAASETPRITGGSISNGQRLVITADDTTIKLFSNDAGAGSYTSATNFSNDTGGKIVFGSGGVSHIADHPRGNNGEYNALDRYGQRLG